MKVFIAIIILFIVFQLSYSQDIEKLTPQPRCAYTKQEISAVFTIAVIQTIAYSDEVPLTLVMRFSEELKKSGLGHIFAIVKLADEPNPSNAVVIGIASNNVNQLINVYGSQNVNVTKDYPGPEGYCLDIMPGRCVINGSDEKGLFYGLMTLKQLYENSSGSLRACRIVDAPEFPNRWLYYPINFLVGANTTKARTIWEAAYRNKLNGGYVADYKFEFNTSMPGSYGDSIRSFRQFAKNNYMDFILACMPFGYSNSLLFNDPNLAAGLPVRNQKFYIESDTGRIVPATNVTLPNPGFENYNGNNFPGFAFIDVPGGLSFVDNTVKHSGNTSIRFSNFEDVPAYKNARVTYRVNVKPFTQFHASAWVKTENLKFSYRFQIMAIGNKGRTLCYQSIDLPANSDWKKYDVTFNSLDSDTMTVYWGVWGPEYGKFWLDDLGLEETAFVNLIRRDGAPLNVSHPILDLIYREGVDYDSLVDPKMGRVYGYGGDYDYWHQPPAFRAKAGGAIKNGDTLMLSYYHTTVIYDSQVMASTTEDKVYEILDKELRNLTDISKPDQFFMNHDEIRLMNWDAGDEAKAKTPGQLLGDNINRCYDIIKNINPTAPVWIWSDMIDPEHNAKPMIKNYYLVNGELYGAVDMIDNSIGIVNWCPINNANKSLRFFSSRGFKQMTAPFYDQDENAIRKSKESAQEVNGFQGMMYTTWANNFDYLEHHGWYSWNHAPFIYHQPPNLTSLPRSMTLEFTIKGDKWDSGWLLDSAFVYYRFSNNDPFTKARVYEDNGSFTFHFEMTGGETFLQYYIEAVDNRKWRTKVPFGKDKYYEYLWSDVTDNQPGFKTKYSSNTETLSVEFRTNDFKIELMNILSQKLITTGLCSDNVNLNLSGLTNGLYFIKLLDLKTNRELIEKFIKY